MWLTPSSASVPGSEVSISDCTQDFEQLADRLGQCAWWRGKPSPSPLWLKRCDRLNWMPALSGLGTSKTYPLTRFPELTGSPADTPASHFPWPENDRGPTTRVICGPPSEPSSALFNQEECSSRTSGVTSHWVSTKSFKTWKAMATAARLDSLQRLRLEPRTEDSESSSWAWPTATVGDSRNSARHTTTAPASKPGTTLVDATRTWPTPTCRDHKDGDTGNQNVPTNGHLGRAANRDPESLGGLLNPSWVEMLMGLPIGWTDFVPSATQ